MAPAASASRWVIILHVASPGCFAVDPCNKFYSQQMSNVEK